MAKFKRKPAAIDPGAVDAFASAAEEHLVLPPRIPEVERRKLPQGPAQRPESEPSHRPWEDFDPTARANRGLNVRFNEYELEILRYLAKIDDRSMHKTLKRLLVPVLEKELRRCLEKECTLEDRDIT